MYIYFNSDLLHVVTLVWTNSLSNVYRVYTFVSVFILKRIFCCYYTVSVSLLLLHEHKYWWGKDSMPLVNTSFSFHYLINITYSGPVLRNSLDTFRDALPFCIDKKQSSVQYQLFEWFNLSFLKDKYSHSCHVTSRSLHLNK